MGSATDFEHYLQELPPPYRVDALNPDVVDGMVREEMMKLSFDDRNTIAEEIHGVRCMAPIETDDFLARSLKELDIELWNIHPAEKRAFLEASSHGKKNSDSSDNNANTNNGKIKYVDTDEFRLRFLRCDLFDAKKAAHRLVKYLDLIAYYLPYDKGLAVLERPITLSDLNEEEQRMLRMGLIQLLPFRDRSGRKVLTVVGTLGLPYNPRAWYKILLYFLWIAGDDLETQQKGIVIVVWPDPDIAKFFPVLHEANKAGAGCQCKRIVPILFQCVPIRVAACHLCIPSKCPIFTVFGSVLAMALVGRRSRFKVHSGEPIELKYHIKSYGVPVDLLPMTSTGNIKLTYLKQWIRLRNVLEKDVFASDLKRFIGGAPQTFAGIDTIPPSSDRPDLIECPGSNDVIFRPGKPVMNHPGNVTFRSLIDSKSSQHDAATQTQKSLIVRQVVEEMIEHSGGRFLIWDEGFCCWKALVEPCQQRHKVAIAFRNFKKHKKAMANRQTVPGNGTITIENNPANAASMIFDKVGNNKKRARLCMCDS